MNPFVEHEVAPDLVPEYEWQQGQGNNGHDFKRILSGGRIVDRQTEGVAKRADHHPREQPDEDRSDGQSNDCSGHAERPAVSFPRNKPPGQQEGRKPKNSHNRERYPPHFKHIGHRISKDGE
ncbi:hypothetical protein D3C72_1216790 [compost metagenome]